MKNQQKIISIVIAVVLLTIISGIIVRKFWFETEGYCEFNGARYNIGDINNQGCNCFKDPKDGGGMWIC